MVSSSTCRHPVAYSTVAELALSLRRHKRGTDVTAPDKPTPGELATWLESLFLRLVDESIRRLIHECHEGDGEKLRTIVDLLREPVNARLAAPLEVRVLPSPSREEGV